MLMMFGYSQGEDVLAKTTPTPDVVDDDNYHYATSLQVLSQKTRHIQGRLL
jgi:hypothetical protein